MKRLLILITPCLLYFQVFSQSYDPAKISKKAIALYNQAVEKGISGDLTASAELLVEAIKKDDKYVDAYLSLGGIYRDMKKYEAS